MLTHFIIFVVDRFSGQVTSLAHIVNTNKIVKEKLTPRQLEMFKKTVFGRFVYVAIVFNNPIIHHMLLREVKSTRADSISFSVGKKFITFSNDDFLLITSLWQSPTRVDQNESSSYELAIKYFSNRVTKDILHVRLLEEKYELEFENDEDVMKITLVYYKEVAMMGKNKQKNAMDLKRFKDVQNIEYYNSLD
ncbi:uncharacterized protein LOC120072125 [Benincasa hispida]|uniref:uncharacterized protein LOC120072125 n=1 Tax=Benincasa hispida TaxID=102211 RepID=UPI0018FF5C81|nr:uncharacterized protein LOC120072125 [Benincasa hispida]